MKSGQNIDQMAALGNLELSPADRTRFSKEFQDILKFVGALQTVSAEDASETAEVTDLENVFRRDDVVPFIHHRALVERAPYRRGDLIRAPGVFSAEGDADDE